MTIWSPWPEVPDLLADLEVPGARWFQPARADIPRLLELVRTYPDIAVGAESVHGQRGFWDYQVHLRDLDGPRWIFPVALERGSRVVALLTVELRPRQRLLEGRLALVAPDERARGIGAMLAGPIPERIGRAVGAELLLSYATLAHRHSQALLVQHGYRLAGVIPGYDLDRLADGTVRRGWEALYVKLLVGAAAVHQPALEDLLPATRAVAAALGLLGRGPAV